MLNYGENDCIELKKHHMNLFNPAKTADFDRLRLWDDWAAEDIKELLHTVTILKEYREEIAKRAQKVACMDFHTRVTLKRERSRWENRIYYHLITDIVLEDGTVKNFERVKYTGEERHKAIKAFRDMKKNCPGYEYIEDIEKPQWER